MDSNYSIQKDQIQAYNLIKKFRFFPIISEDLQDFHEINVKNQEKYFSNYEL